MRATCAIVGMGLTAQGIGLGIGSRELRAQAVDLALADAGLERDAIDGYIHTYLEREDLRYMGLSPNFSLSMLAGGATPVLSIVSAIGAIVRSEEHTSELQSLMRISYAVFCLKKKRHINKRINTY